MHQALNHVLSAYQAAVYAKDVDAFMALYSDNLRVFDMWGTWEYVGLAAWRGMVEEWFGSLGDERVEVGFEEIQTTMMPESAVIHGFFSFAGISAEGEKLRSMQNRMTMVLALQNNEWKIIHEHSSGPLDFTTGKVMLKREPAP